MPYRSTRQRAYLHAKEPVLASRFDKETGGKIVPKAPKPKMPRKPKGKGY